MLCYTRSRMARSLVLIAIIVLAAAPVRAAPLSIVASINVYGDVARQIGGSDVTVTSLLSNPDQDPHLFEASASTARAVSAARVAIENGVDYDPWMDKLLAAARSPDRRTLSVAALLGRKPGDNPHLWYDPATMPALSSALADALAADDPAHASGYRQRLAAFQASLQPIQARIAALRQRLAGTQVTATEPVFGLMLKALGMNSRNQGFQLSVMNDTEPSASDVAGFERDLRAHAVKLLVYNSQATDPVARRMERIARAARVPVIGVTETEPPGTTYQAWMMGSLDAVDRALPPR